MAPARGSWLVPALCKSMWASNVSEPKTHHRLHLLRPSPSWRHAQVTMLCGSEAPNEQRVRAKPDCGAWARCGEAWQRRSHVTPPWTCRSTISPGLGGLSPRLASASAPSRCSFRSVSSDLPRAIHKWPRKCKSKKKKAFLLPGIHSDPQTLIRLFQGWHHDEPPCS